MMSYIFEIFVIFAYIVFFLKLFGGKYQAKGAGREIIQCPPDIDIYEQAFPRMVEMIGLLCSPSSSVTEKEPLAAMMNS